MMTIKEELKELYQKRKSNWNVTSRENKNDIEAEARKFIEEIIIYKFRKIAEKKPFCDFLFIEFNYGTNWTMFFSNIDSLSYMEKDSLISKEVMKLAVNLAKKEYDISVVVEESIENNTRFMFYLDLS